MTQIERRTTTADVATFDDAPSTRRSALIRWVAGGLGILIVGGAVGWALATVLTPPKDVLESSAFTHVEVVEGEVGSSIDLNVVAKWTPTPVGSNQAAGVVTSINVGAGDEVSAGAVLYTVNLRPVVIAQGDVPAFRALASGASGADVSQVQSLLAGLGYYVGPVDGKFGSSTTRAVKAWQRAAGLPADGVVQLGDLVFVPALPTRVSLDTEVIARGTTLSGGEDVVRALSAEPDFTVPLTEAQAGLVATGTRVQITGPEGETWEAFAVGHTSATDDESVVVELAGRDDASICGDQCASIPVIDQSLLRSRIVTVEPVSGPIVPISALRSDAAGTLTVVSDEGTVFEVEIVASAKGMAVVEGIPRGTLVRVPSDGR